MTESTPRTQNDLAVGAIVFERFRILEPIASGAKGRVYRAVDTRLDTEVALKVMLADNRNERDLVRFQTEAKLASKMNHPNIATINDFGLYNDIPFLCMEFVEGQSLEEILKKKRTLSVPEFLEVFFQVCDALTHAHKQAIVHRDIKPANIAVSERPDGSWKVKVLDFGIAKLLDERPEEAGKLTPTGNLVGSPHYMSPEQGQGLAVTTKSDNYALGCVMWRCLTGEPPFSAESVLETIFLHINSPVPKFNEGREHPLPANFASVIEGLLSKNPEERPDIEVSVIPALVELQDSLERDTEQLFAPPEHQAEVETAPVKPPSLFDHKITRFSTIAFLTLLVIGAIVLVSHIISQDRKEMPTVSGPLRDWSLSTVEAITQRHTKEELADPLKGSLDLRGNCSLDDLRKIANNPIVTKLDLAETDLGDSAFPLLAAIPNLENVVLSASKVSKLTNVGMCRKLKFLELKKTQIMDSSLDQLRPLVNLRSLKLNDTKITDQGIAKLVKIQPYLNDLDITGTQVTSEVADYIAELKQRGRVILNRTNVDLSAAKKILRGPRMYHADFSRCPKIIRTDIEKLQIEFPCVQFGETPSLESRLNKEIEQAQASHDLPRQIATAKKLLEVLRNRFGEVDEERVSAAYASLAGLYSQIPDYEIALTFANKALAIAKNTHNRLWLRETYTLKAGILTRLKRYSEVVQTLEQAITAEEAVNGPDTDWGLNQKIALACALRDAGQTERALAIFEKLATIRKHKNGPNAPEYLSVLIFQGDCYARLRKFDLAYAKFNHVASSIDTHPALWTEGVLNVQALTTYHALSELETVRGNKKRALQLSKKAIERMPLAKLPLENRARLAMHYAQVLEANGLTNEAAKAKKKAKSLMEMRNRRSEAKRAERQELRSRMSENDD